METISTHYDFEVPVNVVWPFLENFADIEAWWPKGGEVNIDRVEIEGEGIGLIRHIYNVGFPNAVSERLDYIDTKNHILKLSMVGELPAGLIQYRAIGHLKALDAKRCRLSYESDFVAESDCVQEVNGFLLAAYGLMFRGLEAAALNSQIKD